MQPASNTLKIKTILMPLVMVLSIWLVFWVEYKWDFDFHRWGIYPKTTFGLKGIFSSPFIHGDIQHIWHNTLPLLILSLGLFYFYEKQAYQFLLIGYLGTGMLTWLIGRPSYHIGASGLIYMLFGFLLFKGLFTKHIKLLAVSFFVVFVYGGMLWYVTPMDIEISWEGHLSGFIVGFLLALTKVEIPKIYKTPKYAWEQPNYDPSKDDFMKCFDENGKFIPTSERLAKEKEQENQFEILLPFDNIKVIYTYVPDKQKDE